MRRLWSWLMPEGETRLRPRAFLVLALLTLALHLPGQIGIPAMDRDEARYAQATRQMLASGDFIDIKFADQDRYLQPIGIYWLQAVAALPFGGERAPIWAFRLPSLISALASVLFTAWFATRLFGPGVGLSAGLILAPSLLLAAEAHFAKIDSALLLATLSAQIALYFTIARNCGEPRRFLGWPLVFWIALGVGGLLKGPISLLIVGLTIVAYGILQREWRYLWRDLNPALGVLIVAAIVAPWLIAIYVKTNGEFFRHALGHSLGYKIAHGEQSHGQPPGYHTILLMLTFFPGTLLVGLAGFHAWRNRADRTVRFLISWIVPTWVLFELVATKLPHYTLPVFPALAVLAGLGLRDASEHLARPAGRWWHGIAGLLFLIAAAAVAALPIVAARELQGPVTVIAIFASASATAILLTGALLWWRPRPERILPVVAATALAYLFTFQLVIPSFDQMWVSDKLGRIAATLEGCAQISTATAGYTEPSAVFNFGASTLLGDGASAARHLAAHPACGIAVVEAGERGAFQAQLQADGTRVQSFGRVGGINYVKGEEIDIEIFATETSALELPPDP